jgi:hypothetical protein
MGMHYDVNMSRVKGGARQGGAGLQFERVSWLGFWISHVDFWWENPALGPLRCALPRPSSATASILDFQTGFARREKHAKTSEGKRLNNKQQQQSSVQCQ